MTFERSFYYCSICKNLVELVEDGGGELICCGQPMELLTANTTDAATENIFRLASVRETSCMSRSAALRIRCSRLTISSGFLLRRAPRPSVDL